MSRELREQRARAIARTSVIGGVANLFLSIVKVVAGVIWHSQALVADGIHSFSDLISDMLVWFAGRHSTQEPDLEHPYGHGRYETVATLALGIFLFAVAIGIGWDASDRLFSPDKLLHPEPLALVAAGVSILVKEWLYWWTLGYARRVRSDMLRANAWHHRSDAISSVVVLVGVGGTLAGLPYLDAIAAFIVSVMIARIAWELGSDAVRELVDTGLEEEKLSEIKMTISSVGGVRDIHMLRTRKHGGQASADVHILVDPRVSVSEGHIISVLVEQRLKEQVDGISDVTVHIDPEDDEEAPTCAGLPMRTEALARLDSLWMGIVDASKRKRTVLHYLSGKIDVEVYFPLEQCRGDQAVPVALADRLNAAIQDDPAFRHVRIYFG